jgi:hypothetical protein
MPLTREILREALNDGSVLGCLYCGLLQSSGCAHTTADYESPTSVSLPAYLFSGLAPQPAPRVIGIPISATTGLPLVRRVQEIVP